MTRGWIVYAAALAALGCEAKAQREGTAAADRLSAEYETCGATADCQEPLRCVDAMCRRGARTDVGDYHLAAGRLSLSRDNPDLAVKQLRDAERQYKNEKLEVPPEVYCALGGALSRLRSDPLKAEEAAAKLHRCLGGLPAGSELRRQALDELAVLGDVGFDPVHLGSREVADRYLTKAPRKPPLERLQVQATASPTSNRESFTKWMALLGGPQGKQAVAPCWSAWWKATKEKELVVTLPWRYHFYLDPEEESRDRGMLKVERYKPAPDPNLAAAQKCVEEALSPIAAESAKSGKDHRWKSSITLTIAP